jgi:hypothetical protein
VREADRPVLPQTSAVRPTRLEASAHAPQGVHIDRTPIKAHFTSKATHRASFT